MLVMPGTDSPRARRSMEGIMNGLEIVDVVIGLTLVYLLLASICSLLRERIEAFCKTRAVNLERGIRELLNDPDGTGLTSLLYGHPLVFGLFEGQYEPGKIKPKSGLMPVGTKLPSYIPARNFAQALLDVVARHGAPAPDAGGPGLDLLRDAAGQLGNPMVQRMIESAIDASNGQLDQVRQNLEGWFNSAMDRLSGQYRRRSQSLILWLSLLVALVVNANTLTMVERLSVDPSLRQALVQQATTTAKAQDGTPQWQTLGRLGLPLGWAGGWPGPSGDPLATAPASGKPDWDTAWYYVLHPLLGLLLTAFAVSLGAPFWFDTLNRFVSLRSTLKSEPVAAAAPAAPASQPAPVVQVQLPAAGPAAAAPAPVPAAFEPHQWAQGNPFAGVL